MRCGEGTFDVLRRGVARRDMIVIATVIVLCVMILLLTIPRRRELMRRTVCRDNLYAICKAGLFMAVGNIHRAYGSKSTDEVQGVLRRLPASGALLLIGFFAITGSPMFGPFVSEYQMVRGAFVAGRFWPGIAFLALRLLVFFGMGNTLINCSLGPAPATSPDKPFRETFATIIPIALCMLLTLVLGVYNPPLLTEWVNSAVEYLQRAPGGA